MAKWGICSTSTAFQTSLLKQDLSLQGEEQQLTMRFIQEMSNPHVRHHLVFYPEDAGNHLSEVYQAQHWLHDMDPTLLTPMVRVHGRDFFIFEPTLLVDGSACVPTRWFTRKGSDQFFAEAWHLIAHIVANQPGWVVMEHATFVLSSEHLLHNFSSFGNSYMTYNLPHPASIHGAHRSN